MRDDHREGFDADGLSAGTDAITAAAPIPAAAAAQPLAVDDGDHNRNERIDNGDAAIADRAGECGIIFATAAAASTAAAACAGCDLLNLILTGDQTGDNQRFIDFCAASGAACKGFAAWVAWSGDADGQRARRTALVAARLKQDAMDDQRGSVFILGLTQMGRIAENGVQPLREGTVGMLVDAAAAAAEMVTRMAVTRHHMHLRMIL